jgi:alpha-glucosidase (family GH31 glycosyl hydrolase)
MSTSTPTRALGILALAASLGACSTSATSPLGEEPIRVSLPAGRVVIDRAPFGLRIEDAAGRTALALATGKRTAGDVVYAPLLRSTGGEPELAYPVLPGSIDTNPANPTPARRFSVTGILDATAAGGTATVKLATDDPGGGTITLHVGPEGDAAIALEITAEGASALSAAFASGADEAFHGFGGRREGTNLRGYRIRNWVLDYRFPDVSPAYYYAQPFFVSSRGYGLLLDQDENAVFRMDSDVEDAWRAAVVGPRMKLVVAPREAGAAIDALTAITGRHRRPPAWSMGATISRAVQPGKTPADYQQAVVDDLDRIQIDALPVTAYCFEGAAQLPDAFVASTIATLTARGIHPVLYIRGFVGQDIAGTQAPGDYDEALAGGYVATGADGKPYLAPSPFVGASMAIVDFTNPAAKAWWQAKLRAMLDKGADGFMSDFGEQVLSDMRFADGTTGVETHNRYPVLQQQAAREAVDAFVKDHPEREIYFFGRAGYAGRPGSAAYENATFPGDELNDWSKVGGLPSIIPDMLNRAVGGAYAFTTDIAGYADFKFAPATKEIYIRWSQAAALTPFFRVHNGPLTGPRMPWSYDAEVEDAWTAMATLHTSVLPDYDRAWDEALATGMPVVRPLWLADPASAATPHNDDEWLVGADLLAAPVVEEGATQREVWIPTGCWQLKATGEKVTGPKAITVDAPLTDLPWFRRCAAP